MQLNLEWLRTFKAIYETGTLSAAAQELYISQPGVSLHLNSLEAYTGYKLFERSTRRMIPTEKGKIFYNFIQEPIKKLQSAEQQFHKRSEAERPTISLGMCFETFQYTLEEHIPSLRFNLIIKFGEYPQMQHDLDQGMLDLIVTPEKGNQKNLVYQAFAKERIVLIAGGNTDVGDLSQLLEQGNTADAAKLLKQQPWYSTAADMEHLKAFWVRNFGEHPDFRPNYIVPNISSIIRCLSVGQGFSIVPDFLCLDAIEGHKIKQVWEGTQPLENTLYFGTRKNTAYQNELTQLEGIFRDKWQKSSI
jgi:DNA-binding transcriptional LysR family regulator